MKKTIQNVSKLAQKSQLLVNASAFLKEFLYTFLNEKNFHIYNCLKKLQL